MYNIYIYIHVFVYIYIIYIYIYIYRCFSSCLGFFRSHQRRDGGPSLGYSHGAVGEAQVFPRLPMVGMGFPLDLWGFMEMSMGILYGEFMGISMSFDVCLMDVQVDFRLSWVQNNPQLAQLTIRP